MAPPPDTTDTPAAHVLAYHERLRQISSADLGQEVTRLSAALATNGGGPESVLDLALALGQTRNSGDLTRALALLDPIVRSNAPELQPWLPIARLIQARYAEQRRLEEQVDRQVQQLRDGQRKLDQLNEKLEALKAIERSLTTRPAPPAAAAASPSPPASAAPKAP